MKCTRNETRQTKQFKVEDATFFKKNELGQLQQLSRKASDDDILNAAGCTLKLDNSKNGWKGVSIYQEWNGDDYFCGVRAIGRQYCHVRRESKSTKTFLSAYWVNKN